LATNSWDALRPKLRPNPQQSEARPIIAVGMGATTAGVALTTGSLILLLGITGLPTTPAAFGNESTWRLILGVVCLYTSWSVVSNGNNFFCVSRPLGYITCLGGAVALVVVARDVVITAAHLEVTAVVLQDPLTAAMVLGTFLAGLLLLRVGNVRFAGARRYLTEIVRHPSDLRGLGYSVYLRTFALDDRLAGAQAFTRSKRALRSLFVVEHPEELLVADALSSDDAPLIGVGFPGEPAPHVGALRVYLPGADWQPQVHELIQGARHVVLALGWGEGTLWELREAMRLLKPEQLIVVVPMEEPEYERFRAKTAGSLPAELPPWAGRREVRSVVRGLITFSEGWKATFVPVRAYSPFHNSLRIAVLYAAWPALRRLGYPPRGVLRWAPGTPR
jgi:hypothetical protein